MSQTRSRTSRDQVQKLKSLSVPYTTCEVLAVIARVSLLLCLVSSISLAIYTSFYDRQHWLRSPNITRSSPYRRADGPTNISHVVFGLGGSTATWDKRSLYSSVWWSPNVTRGFVWLDTIPKTTTNITSPKPPCRVSSPEWKRFRFSSSRSAVRIARIVTDTFKLGLPNVRWFVMGDDDTVYFTHNLESVLAKYDHNQMWYIGGNSESVEQNLMHSYDMAFGGGGFAISYPLAERLVAVFDGCLDRYFKFYGSDQRIWACISEIGVRLTRERGFHQLDIRGNPYGLLAAHPSAPLVSLHHLDHLSPLFPDQDKLESLRILTKAYHLDPPRILQQTFCHDHKRQWSLSVSWGYTVQLYPLLLPAMDLQTPLRTFKTWRSWSNGPFTFNTRPISPNPCEQPFTFMLNRFSAVDDRGTLTGYKRVAYTPDNKCSKSAAYTQALSISGALVSSVKMDPYYWTKDQARRRQCCELVRVEKSIMHIRIRNCRSWETVTT
ncbi:hypothetical protein K2173_012932 [Erythroxylum novogranatense]|uniref:Uncharacterized protein n=1 Tax=Erythroxylum novogranatense TaxID=1862640 RepID=A0AAV8S5B9_9ROSI|nr:hypothetical protein K2173_012932 [Erythroxylum novogranatense]